MWLYSTWYNSVLLHTYIHTHITHTYINTPANIDKYGMKQVFYKFLRMVSFILLYRILFYSSFIHSVNPVSDFTLTFPFHFGSHSSHEGQVRFHNSKEYSNCFSVGTRQCTKNHGSSIFLWSVSSLRADDDQDCSFTFKRVLRSISPVEHYITCEVP